MPISVSEWRSVRHISAEGSGVAGAVGNWVKFCTDPAKLNDPGRQKAIITAEALRRALETAKGKLKEDAKLKGKLSTLKRTNPTEGKKKAELVILEKQVEADSEKVSATHALIKEWDAQVAKYIRAAMKSAEGSKRELENHKAEIQEQIKLYVTCCQLAEKGRIALEDGVHELEALVGTAEQVLVQTVKAKRTNAVGKLQICTESATKIRKKAEKRLNGTRTDAKGMLDQSRKLFIDPKPLIKHSLTNAKLGALIDKASDKAQQEADVLEEAMSYMLEPPYNEVLKVLDKIVEAATTGLDEVQEITASLGRGVDRLTSQIGNLNQLIALGIGGNVDMARSEFRNIDEGKATTQEALTDMLKKIEGCIKLARKSTPNAEASLKRAMTEYEGLVSMLPDDFESSSGEAKGLVDELESLGKELEGFEKTHAKNTSRLVELENRFKTEPKTLEER